MSLLNLAEFGFRHMVMDGMINSCTIVIGIYPFPIHITPSILYISEKIFQRVDSYCIVRVLAMIYCIYCFIVFQLLHYENLLLMIIRT